MLTDADKRARRFAMMLLVCLCRSVIDDDRVLAQPNVVIPFAGTSGAPSLPTLSDVANKPKRSEGWFRIPTIHFQLSTPSNYLYGWHDDFERVQGAADYSEYGFTLYSDKNTQLRLASEAKTDRGAKPFYETRGAQLFLKHQLPLYRIATEVFHVDADFGQANLTYGIRYQSADSTFYWLGIGSFLGATSTDTYAENHYLGPQIALNWARRKHGFMFECTSQVMMGSNTLNSSQFGFVGAALSPGLPNRSLNAKSNTFSHSSENQFSATIAEVRASVSYPILDQLDLRIGYIGVYFSEMRLASDVIRWSLPDLGIDPSQSSDLWLDRVYASIEWRL
ncbi:MAG: BBP7 family outer membrane beta-barrel protein [Planctomycetota bacterium]